MYIKIIALCGFIFAAVYPLCFWFTLIKPLKEKYHKYHLRIVNFVSGAAVITALFSHLSIYAKILILLWKVTLLCETWQFWKKKYPNLMIITITSVLGLSIFSLVHYEWYGLTLGLILFELLLASAVCFTIFYLNRNNVYASMHQIRKAKKLAQAPDKSENNL